MTRLRKRVSDRLKQAQNTYAMLTTFNEVDMTNLMASPPRPPLPLARAHGPRRAPPRHLPTRSARNCLSSPPLPSSRDTQRAFEVPRGRTARLCTSPAKPARSAAVGLLGY